MANPRALAVVYLKGLCMGAADAVPGVSGGTVALITGIYERLVAAITAVDPGRVRAVLAGVLPGRRRAALAALRAVDAPFLLALGAGVLTAVVAIASAVEAAVESAPVPTFGFFLGLIGASAVVLGRDRSLDTPGRVAAGAAGFLAAFLLSGRAVAGLGHGPVVTFVAGTVAVSAMVLPGVSGSLLLLLLGQYTYMTGTLAALRDGVLAGRLAVEPAAVAATFVAGALVGLFSVAHVVRRALAARREATLAFLVGLVVGALRAPVARIDVALVEAGRGWSGDVLLAVAVTALLGGVVVAGLERYGGGMGY